jgi:hypothetical protein
MASLNSVGFSTNENEVDLESLRARLRKMTDAELAHDIRPGKVCAPRRRILESRRVRPSLFNLGKRGQSRSTEN